MQSQMLKTQTASKNSSLICGGLEAGFVLSLGLVFFCLFACFVLKEAFWSLKFLSRDVSKGFGHNEGEKMRRYFSWSKVST